MIKKILFIFFLLYLNNYKIFSQSCGKERWGVKTLTDSDTTKINFNHILRSSIHEQISIHPPDGKLNKRIASETTVYSITCYIVSYKKESDQDIHLVIMDPETKETMVAEIANPSCTDVMHSNQLNKFIKTYDWFISHIGKPTSKFKNVVNSKPVTITGVGFWDHLHGQKGMANGGREIHPVLSIKFQ